MKSGTDSKLRPFFLFLWNTSFSRRNLSIPGLIQSFGLLFLEIPKNTKKYLQYSIGDQVSLIGLIFFDAKVEIL